MIRICERHQSGADAGYIGVRGYVGDCPVCALGAVKDLQSLLQDSEKERAAQTKCADAYFNALAAIRGALEMPDDEDHLFVLDAIERLKHDIQAARAERLEAESRLDEAEAEVEFKQLALNGMRESADKLAAERDSLEKRADEIWSSCAKAQSVSAAAIQELSSRLDAANEEILMLKSFMREVDRLAAEQHMARIVETSGQLPKTGA